MKIKICGIFRDQDVYHVNEARPDYTGFVFAPSRREVSFAQAEQLRSRLADGITVVGVFVNAATKDIIALYRNGVISIAQLHGNEDEAYIDLLKNESVKNGLDPIPVIKVIKSAEFEQIVPSSSLSHANYYLIDSGAGTGKAFNWDIFKAVTPCTSWLRSSGKPWFFAGGINVDNIAEAMSFNPFCVDISSGAESDGVKDRKKIIQLTEIVRKGNTV